MGCDIRQKLDRRIHNQRVALRETWQIIENRREGARRHEMWLFKRISEICDKAGIPRQSEGVGIWTIGWRMSQLEQILEDQARGK